MSFIAELKRRKVFKVGAGYLVVAWLAVQAASIGFPAFDAPPWALRIFILVSLLGFPLALVMAWIFDATPEGMKLDSRGTGRAGLFAAAAVLIALAFGWYFYGQPSFRKDDVATPVAAQSNSIAVLPFANMSGKADEEYFSDGMTEELLNVLAKVPQLQVVARTSVFQFKGKGGDVREIGRKLGVSHVVEGSIRRDGQQVRINAQLIRVADGFQVWSETYDRKLEGVFALQDEIAGRIGDALKLSLGVGAGAAPRASNDPAAYDDYLKGRALLRARKELPQAISHLRAAVAKAPGFAAGWSSLSLACEVRFWYALMTPAEQADMLACSAGAAKHAAERDPGAATTEHALANVARSRFRFAEAEGHYLRAMQIDPGYPDVREDYAEMLYEVGRLDDCEAAVRQLTRLDPYFIVAWTRMRDIAVFFDRRADLEEAARQALAIAPESRFAWLAPLEYPLVLGRADEARAALVRIQAQGPKGLEFLQVLVPWALGDEDVDPARLDAAIAEAPAGAASPYLVARGDIARYNDYIASAGAIPQGYYFVNMYRSKLAGHAMLRDPRVKAKLVEYGFVAYWREKGWPAGCRPLGATDFECGQDVAGNETP
jgi:TolB-like protein/Tfp pilus assembly protein PilF